VSLPDCGTAFERVRQGAGDVDLAGQNGQVNSLEGAGGIGGLLAVYDLNDTPGAEQTGDDLQYVYAYNGNGNVVQVLDWSASSATNAIVAKYEYDPYGNVVAQAGDYAERNPFRFSTKYWDADIGMLYYEQRWYLPKLGRWASKDPIEEEGGLNLYRFVANAPTTLIDAFGLQAAGRGATCGIKVKRSAICTLSPKTACDFGHEWIEGGGTWDYPKDYADDPCHAWDRAHPVWEWNAHVRLLGGSLPDGTSCAKASCAQIKNCLQAAEGNWAGTPYSFLGHNCINFVDAALSRCCMARGALPTRMPKPFEEARLCCERCKEMRAAGCSD